MHNNKGKGKHGEGTNPSKRAPSPASLGARGYADNAPTSKYTRIDRHQHKHLNEHSKHEYMAWHLGQGT
jgi:hypothetical protein